MALIVAQQGVASGSSAGGSPSFNWRFSTDITATDPGAEMFKYNDATLGNVTQIFLSDTSISAIDVSLLVPNLALEDTIFVKQGDTPANSVLFNVNGTPTDNTGWWTIPVTVENAGTLHGNNAICGLNFMFTSNLDANLYVALQRSWFGI